MSISYVIYEFSLGAITINAITINTTNIYKLIIN